MNFLDILLEKETLNLLRMSEKLNLNKFFGVRSMVYTINEAAPTPEMVSFG